MKVTSFKNFPNVVAVSVTDYRGRNLRTSLWKTTTGEIKTAKVKLETPRGERSLPDSLNTQLLQANIIDVVEDMGIEIPVLKVQQ